MYSYKIKNKPSQQVLDLLKTENFTYNSEEHKVIIEIEKYEVMIGVILFDIINERQWRLIKSIMVHEYKNKINEGVVFVMGLLITKKFGVNELLVVTPDNLGIEHAKRMFKIAKQITSKYKDQVKYNFWLVNLMNIPRDIDYIDYVELEEHVSKWK